MALPLTLACGSSDSSTASDSTTGADTDDGQIATYQTLVVDVQTASEAYLREMTTGNVAAIADCQLTHDNYDGLVRPWLGKMVEMSGGMDGHMMTHGGHGSADIGCVTGSMLHELNQHNESACRSPDAATNLAEVERHVNLVIEGCTHIWGRCNELRKGFDDGVWGFGPMVQSCMDWDGCCSSMTHSCCQGMMGWMHSECCDS